MTLMLDPEIGVPFSDKVPYIDLRARAEAACNSAMLLSEHGLDVEPTKEDQDTAAKLALAYAEDPEKTSKKVNNKRAATLTPASLIITGNILKEFGHSVVESSVQIRHLVTNKLIDETMNPDPRVRIRALELLGKISDVGLFAEKTEVTITHQTTDDIKERLRSKLMRLVNPEETEEATFIDIDAILGDDDEPEDATDTEESTDLDD
tara:strand:+ start:114 stop:734 length:621 start_codon:yes stop_codon:yes gene_type:complete